MEQHGVNLDTLRPSGTGNWYSGYNKQLAKIHTPRVYMPNLLYLNWPSVIG